MKHSKNLSWSFVFLDNETTVLPPVRKRSQDSLRNTDGGDTCRNELSGQSKKRNVFFTDKNISNYISNKNTKEYNEKQLDIAKNVHNLYLVNN